MLKVIKISGGIGDLTVDSTLITADSTLITADATEFYTSYELKIPYRFFNTDVNLYLFNEFTEEENNIQLTAVESDGYMILTFNYLFKNGETFEAKVTNDDKLIWRGKIFATTQDNLQDFSLTRKDNNIIYV